ncbi:MAG TPA: hypothetical protein VHD87_08700 [Acidimicrobiales bacterium]|nr:hypothetical protein [Acidimicrobiales bacterium]
MNRTYTVPRGQRLVIDSVYVEAEEFVVAPYSGRSGIQAGVVSAYDLGKNCAFPGWERDYGVTLTNPVSQPPEDNITQKQFYATIPGPIFVEGGRTVSGLALAPGGDDVVWMHVVAHGHLEASLLNPSPPTCG